MGSVTIYALSPNMGAMTQAAIYSSLHRLSGDREVSMNRQLPLKITLVIVGVLFLALTYPMLMFLRQEPALSMMLSLYVTLGVFLLMAVRQPSANRSLIGFTAWSSLAHAALMGFQAWRHIVARAELIGVAVLVVIGAVLIALAPRKADHDVLFTPE